MKLILHIVGKDLRRMRWWLVAWAAVLAVPVLVGFGLLAEPLWLNASNWSLRHFLDDFAIFEILAGYFLGIVLWQQDPVLGTQQFWLTRPISRPRLLIAKALGLLVVLAIIPSLVSLPWWLWCGLGWREIAVAALDMVALALVVGVPAALVATLTENFPRAMLWSLVLFTIVLATIGFGLTAFRSPREAVGGAVVAVVIVITEMALFVVAVFLSRRRPWSLVVAAALIIVSGFGGMVMGSSLHPDAPLDHKAERAANVVVEFKRAEVYRPYSRRPGSDSYHRLETTFSVKGVPNELSLNLIGGHQTWRAAKRTHRYPGSPRWNPDSWLPSPLLDLNRPSEDPETERWMAEIRARNKVSGDKTGIREELAFDAHFWSAAIESMRAEAASYEATLFLQLHRPELVYEIDLRPRSWIQHAGRQARVHTLLEERRDNLRLAIVDSTAAPLKDFLGSLAEVGRHYFFARRPLFIAANRERGEFMTIHGAQGHSLTINGVRVGRHTFSVYPPMLRRGSQWIAREGWLEGATLVFLSMRQVAVFSRQVKVEHVTFTDSDEERF